MRQPPSASRHRSSPAPRFRKAALPRSLAAALGLALLGGCQDAGPPDAPRPLGPADGQDLPGVALDRIQVGEPAPDFTLEAYGGGTVTLSDYRGRKDVILVFYRGHW